MPQLGLGCRAPGERACLCWRGGTSELDGTRTTALGGMRLIVLAGPNLGA